MKKIVALLAVLFLCGISHADETPTLTLGDTFHNLPSLKHGAMWNYDTHRLEYIMTTQIIEYKNISFEAGYDVANSIIAVASYRLGGLKDMGVNVPILEFIEFNVGFGVGYNVFGEDGHDEHISYGPCVSLVNTKF